MKKTAIIGASPNPNRYSYLATQKLVHHGHSVVPLGIKEGQIGMEQIIMDWPDQIDSLDTITLYVGPARQPEYYEYLIGLNPKRIIFNPGTENPAFYALLKEKGIEYEEACTLVLLSTGAY